MELKIKFMFLASALLLSACSGGGEEKANELYVQAESLVGKGVRIDSSEGRERLIKAADKVDRILVNYPSTRIAVDLVSGNVRLLDLHAREIIRASKGLSALNEGEISLVSASDIISRLVDDTDSRLYYLLRKIDVLGLLDDTEELDRAFSELGEYIDVLYIGDLISAMIEDHRRGVNLSSIKNLDDAIKVLERSPEIVNLEPDYFLIYLFEYFVSVENIVDFEFILREVDDPALTKRYLLELAYYLAEDGQKDRASEYIQESLSVEASFDDFYEGLYSLDLILGYLMVGSYEEAQDQILIYIGKIQDDYMESELRRGVTLVNRLLNAEFYDQATYVSGSLNDFLMEIKQNESYSSKNSKRNSKIKARLSSAFAGYYANKSQTEKVDNLISEIETLSIQAEDLSLVVNAYINIASGFFEVGSNRQAIEYLEKIELSFPFDNNDDKRLEISRLYLNNGYREEALAQILKIESLNSQSRALLEMAVFYHENNLTLTDSERTKLISLVDGALAGRSWHELI